MFKRYFFVMLCGILANSSNGYARTYSKENAMRTLTMGLAAHLNFKTELKNAVVIDFVNLDGKTTMLGRYIAEDLSTRLAKSADFKIIERRYANKVITEKEYNLSDFVEPTNAASLGKLVGAQGIVIGTITEIKGAFQINARIIQTKTSEVLSSYEVKMEKDIDTMKLASQVITPKVKKKKVIKKTAPKPEAKQELKKERPIVKEKPKSKEKIFYFEDFSEVKEGMVPKGWMGCEHLMVKKGKRDKYLKNFEGKGAKIIIPDINLPKNWKIEMVVVRGAWSGSVSCSIGNLNFGYKGGYTSGSQCFAYIKDTFEKVFETPPNATFIMKLEKKGPLFTLFIDGAKKVFIRYSEFEPSDKMNINFTRSFRLYSIKGTDLTQKNPKKNNSL